MWPRGDRGERFVVECKVRHGNREETECPGLYQIAAYVDCCAAEVGHLVLFDRTPHRSWKEKISRRETMVGETSITIWRM